MNKRLCRWIIAILLAAPIWAWAADPILQISVLRKAGEGKSTEVPGEGEIAKGQQKFYYAITVANQSAEEAAALEVRYMIFVDRQKVGEKPEIEHTQRINGRKTLDPIKSHAQGVISTRDVGLTQSNLTGGYYYPNGGRISAKDSIKGIWVRVYQGEKMITEYINPTTIKAHESWKD